MEINLSDEDYGVLLEAVRQQREENPSGNETLMGCLRNFLLGEMTEEGRRSLPNRNVMFTALMAFVGRMSNNLRNRITSFLCNAAKRRNGFICSLSGKTMLMSVKRHQDNLFYDRDTLKRTIREERTRAGLRPSNDFSNEFKVVLAKNTELEKFLRWFYLKAMKVINLSFQLYDLIDGPDKDKFPRVGHELVRIFQVEEEFFKLHRCLEQGAFLDHQQDFMQRQGINTKQAMNLKLKLIQRRFQYLEGKVEPDWPIIEKKLLFLDGDEEAENIVLRWLYQRTLKAEHDKLFEKIVHFQHKVAKNNIRAMSFMNTSIGAYPGIQRMLMLIEVSEERCVGEVRRLEFLKKTKSVWEQVQIIGACLDHCPNDSFLITKCFKMYLGQREKEKMRILRDKERGCKKKRKTRKRQKRKKKGEKEEEEEEEEEEVEGESDDEEKKLIEEDAMERKAFMEMGRLLFTRRNGREFVKAILEESEKWKDVVEKLMDSRVVFLKDELKKRDAKLKNLTDRLRDVEGFLAKQDKGGKKVDDGTLPKVLALIKALEKHFKFKMMQFVTLNDDRNGDVQPTPTELLQEADRFFIRQRRRQTVRQRSEIDGQFSPFPARPGSRTPVENNGFGGSESRKPPGFSGNESRKPPRDGFGGSK